MTLLLPNPSGRFPLACGDDPGTLGLRVPIVSAPELRGVRWPVLQSSANRAGGPDPRRLEDVPELLRAAADLIVDGGELPGTSSTVIDLRRYEEAGEWSVVRAGAVSEEAVRRILGGQFHFDPASYLTMMQDEVPAYERLQDELVAATAGRVARAGYSSWERVRARRRGAYWPATRMRRWSGSIRVRACWRRRARRSRRREPSCWCAGWRIRCPAAASTWWRAHSPSTISTARARRTCSGGWRAHWRPGGRFVLADVVVPADPADAVTPLTAGFDRPSTVAEQLHWLEAAGFSVRVCWESRDLAVIAAELGR